jgi:hypothetical protein
MPSTTSRRAGAKAHRAAAPASAARNCRLRGREKSVIRPRRDEALLGRQRFAGFFAGGQWIRNFRSAVPSVVSGISAARDRAGTTFARSSRPSEFLARSGCTPPAGEEPNDRLSQSGTRSSNPASSSGESANFRSLMTPQVCADTCRLDHLSAVVAGFDKLALMDHLGRDCLDKRPGN